MNDSQDAATKPIPTPDDVARLQQQLRARDKTIAALMYRVEEHVANHASAFAVLEQNSALQRVIESKTREVERERGEIAKTLRELRSTQAQLLQAQKLESIGQLAAGIAHEINTPVQYVSDNVGFLKRCFDLISSFTDEVLPLIDDYRLLKPHSDLLAKTDNAMRRAKLDYVRKQVPAALEQAIEGLQRVVVIVSAMKQFSHPSPGERTPVDLGELIRTTVTIARHEWKYVADLELQLDETLPPVPCQRNEISQVLLNLIVNAAHAIGDVVATKTDGRGRITISTSQHEHYAQLCVSDTGTGIPEAARDRVFDPFFTTKGVGKGTGQGLAIAYATVVEKHQGQIFFDTTPGQGTHFFVRLPLCAAGDKKDARA